MILPFLFEIWREIPSEPELLASSYGRIQILPYKIKMPYGGEKWSGGTPTFGQWAKEDQRFLYCRRGHKTLKVARLVCEAFHGPPPFPRAVVMHDDENPRNNCPENLKWGTQKENLNYPGFIKYCKARTGENSPTVKGMKRARSD